MQTMLEEQAAVAKKEKEPLDPTTPSVSVGSGEQHGQIGGSPKTPHDPIQESQRAGKAPQLHCVFL